MKLHMPLISIALAVPEAAMAQDFSGKSTWRSPSLVGGVGPEGMATLALFALRLSCGSRTEEPLVSMTSLCVWRGESAPEAAVLHRVHYWQVWLGGGLRRYDHVKLVRDQAGAHFRPVVACCGMALSAHRPAAMRSQGCGMGRSVRQLRLAKAVMHRQMTGHD